MEYALASLTSKDHTILFTSMIIMKKKFCNIDTFSQCYIIFFVTYIGQNNLKHLSLASVLLLVYHLNVPGTNTLAYFSKPSVMIEKMIT
jgi:hypothetical protein